MKKLALILCLTLLDFFAFAQSGNNGSSNPSGYYGSLNGLSFNYTLSPSRFRVRSITEINNVAFTKSRLKFATVGFNLEYSRIFARKVETVLSYGYARIKSDVQRIDYSPPAGQDLSIIEDLRGNKHQIGLKLQFYGSKSFAPIGSYFSIETQLGVASFAGDSMSVGTLKSQSALSGFVSRYSRIESQEKVSINITDNKANFFALRVGFGNNTPLTKNLLLKTAISIPAISRQFRKSYLPTNGSEYLTSDLNKDIEDGNVRPLLYKTIYRSHIIVLEIGLRYQL